MYDKEKAKNYYQKNKTHILQVHQDWAKRNVDQAGSVWRKYGRWSRIRNPNIDKEYYARHREEILLKKKIYYRKKEGLMYKPLPDSLTIKQSGIDGLGLFARHDLAPGTNLGMSHLKIGDTIYHANEANCVKAELRMIDEDIKGHEYNYKKWNLITSQDIKAGEELTVRYTFYNV